MSRLFFSATWPGLRRKSSLSPALSSCHKGKPLLVAKQAAALDVLSGGRLRLGVGIGWNPVEYEALGETSRIGAASEEQVEVMRKLWTQELVTFQGQWHTITDAGLNPLPVHDPFRFWFGGGDDRALRRLARLGDGWFPCWHRTIIAELRSRRFKNYAREAGRDPSRIGIEGRITFGQGSAEGWIKDIDA